MHHFTELFGYRDLLWLWTLREVRVRYKQSFLGVAWAIIQPLALTVVFTVVFSFLLKIDTGDVPYPVFAYTGLVPWTFFATSLAFGIPSLVNNMNLVTKIYFPREILPLASIGAAFVDFLIACAILAGLMLIYRVFPGIEALWLGPLLLLQIILSIGVILLGAALIVFFRDIRFVVPLLTQVWMYATPIIYPVDFVPEQLRPFYFLNPMAGIIDGYRRVLIYGEAPNMQALTLATIVSVILFVVGYLVFKRTEPVFADII
ncbi:MAG: ABC transporter permease [Chloroflexota bacterium]|nr:ABC transporter permease [Chloroflexota bacterium]